MKCLVNESPYKVRLALDGLVKTLGTLSFLIIIPIMQGLAEGEVKIQLLVWEHHSWLEFQS